MPTINTPVGKIRYKTKALYLGVKRINKEIANENLLILKRILDSHKIPFQLHAGTLLGAKREHDFIDHDEDIDLALLDKYRNDILQIIPELASEGFEICRFDHRDLLSIMRRGEYIDFYFYKDYSKNLLSCSGWLVLRSHLENSVKYEFKGNYYDIPRDWEDYLVSQYGNNWKTPLKWNNYEMPKWKRMVFYVKEHLKDYIPGFILPYLLSHASKKLTKKSIERLKKNLNLDIFK